MKIVLFTEFFPRNDKYFTGGVEVRVRRLYEYLKKTKHDVAVVSRSEGYSFNSPLTAIQRIFFFFRWIAKIIFTRLPTVDVVEGTNFTTYILAFIYAKKIKAKAIAWYPDVFLGKAIERLGFINGLLTEISERISVRLPWDKIIALSEETKKKLIEAGVDRRKIEVIYGGVDYNSYNAYSRYSKFKTPTIICISRLVKYKRIQDLILAVYLLKDTIPNTRLIVVGEGPEKDKLKVKSEKLKVKAEFFGRVSEEKKWELLSKSHIHVLPSAIEGFGLVTIEALSVGTPVVNADIPINKEVLNGSKGGLLYELGDYVDLSEKLEELLTDQKLYDRKAEEGLELVKKYDWDKVNKKYEHLLFN
ncbi:glycosyltransferase family 4 protein [Candidatus Collierbacteria bacterium]|nr:glycosyltransferase family 4 protein [Candidatus Collierbacteria bacterium]